MENENQNVEVEKTNEEVEDIQDDTGKVEEDKASNARRCNDEIIESSRL